MPEINEPDAVATASACWCLSEPAARAATLYLLNRISGLNLTPKQLAEASKCYCLNSKATDAAELYLLNTIANQ